MAGTGHTSIWTVPERPARGPRPAYSRAQITATAVAIADAEGLEAASMRRIAAELGTGAMSLYRYVPSRGDLLALMVDHVLGEAELPERPSGDWRADLRLYAHHTRAVAARHRWLWNLNPRPEFGPNQLRVAEFAFGALDIDGLTIDDIFVYVGMVTGYAQNAVRDEIGASEGESAEERMRRSAPYVRSVLATGRYPMFERIIREARQPHMTPDERFAYGLERVLDGIAAQLPDRSGLTEAFLAGRDAALLGEQGRD
ncbi:TetR/AcrR family transcriptional regulator [Actinomadura parmotrematis]|uniref:TetR/AcrR family transcriptional regulator n=1 Tax=Actinomadura parmotrematis TaxID=2864039 RepID=A0ABS7FRI1_9ACTN|nr:TetR/AcrR family transcriptional regulator [Actinomadura parmotrematis]MBW8482580.1 TetR/AcrR family transcriptional regulator [Actinomadura parmotrematis]